MPLSSRLTDLWSGICCCHTDPPCIGMSGPIIIASSNVISGNFGQARLTDQTVGWCGHPGNIVTASSKNIANNLGKVRIGDVVNGCNIGTVITGSPKHMLCEGGGTGPAPVSTTISFQGQDITYTEVDFGNVDDEPDSDDGLNIFPPTTNPSPAQIAKSQALDNSPTTEVEDSTADIVISTPPTSCLLVPDPAPSTFGLSTNFTLGHLSTNAVISKVSVRAQHGLTIQDIVCNLQALAENILEPLSSQYGRGELIITSGFRVGSSTSQHERGQAADIQFPLKTNTEVYNIALWMTNNLPFDQLILEYGGNKPWIHVSYNRSGNRPATASNKYGTRVAPGNYIWGVLKNMI